MIFFIVSYILINVQLRTFGPPTSWAIVTGASDGLGKEFALHLARTPFNLLLISRTASKLSALAAEIESQNPNIKIETWALDFAHLGENFFTSFAIKINSLDIAILVNNVGKSHDIPVSFIDTDEEEMEDIVTVNCLGTLRMTALVAPKMVKQKRGLILTMGSFGGLMPTPLLATYSGSKAFLQHWSTALASELQPHGVTVQLVQSYLVTSAMSKIRRPSLMVPSAKVFVKTVLRSIGRSGGAQGFAWTSTPYWSHAIMQWGISTFATLTGTLVAGINKGMHEGIRKRGLRKKAREEKKSS